MFKKPGGQEKMRVLRTSVRKVHHTYNECPLADGNHFFFVLSLEKESINLTNN